ATGTLTFTSAFDTTTPLSFTLPTVLDNLVEGSENYTVALSTPATSAPGASVALGAASVTTTIIDSGTQTISLTEASQTVTEGSADSYAAPLSEPRNPSPRAAPTATPSPSPARSVPASPSASTSPSTCRVRPVAPMRRTSPMLSWLMSRRQSDCGPA